ncbi:MAG: electron transport complex subunit RsxC [Bacteroidales bacterium]|nr:electron transport complex subunit RsxC [Bacteroidales bacterium]MBN2757624.1 electron transport complex subunit RsxC [Bacteroidales bacterium]
MLKTFSKGGVHPAENKLSAEQSIKTLPIPKTVTIPISQHIGAPATVIVKKNDIVKVGQIIAQSGGFVSANIHSSVSGKVTKIDSFMDSSGYKKQAVVIDVEGDEWDESIVKNNEVIRDCNLSSEEIIKKVGELGIVGLGGATFPSQVKLSVPKGMTAEVLIINGVECEPYLTSDHRLMLEKGLEMLVGTSILMKALNVTKAIVGIENNKKDAIEHLTKLSEKFSGIEVQALKVKYPQGGEKQLIKALINREVPSGGLPIAVGAVVHNVGTAYAVYEAVQKNKPLFERVVSVTGKSVKNPSNYLTRIGTSVSELIEAAGGLPEDTGKVISGGPMMGKALNTIDVPVTKGTSGVLIIPEGESRRGKVSDCIRCSKCVSVCPMGLEPFLLMTVAEKQNYERAEKEKTMDCIECGSCSYTCPSNRPLLDYIRLSKFEVGKIMRSRKS